MTRLIISPVYYRVFFEPTDQRKAVKSLNKKIGPKFATPNLSELRAMASVIKPELKINLSNDIHDVLQLCKIVSQTITFLIVTMGSKGVITVQNFSNGKLDARHYSVEPLKAIVSVSGAGDCFASGFIHGMLAGYMQSTCIQTGFEAAVCALSSQNTVPIHFSKQLTNKKANYTRLDIDSL